MPRSSSAGSSRPFVTGGFSGWRMLNCAVRELLERLNQRALPPKREGSRASVFAALERSALRPLPAERFDMSQWSRARVNIDYHIAFEGNFYSVPYTLVQERVEVRSTPATVEIFITGSAWLRISAVARAAKPSPRTSTGRKHHQRIWSGRPRAW